MLALLQLGFGIGPATSLVLCVNETGHRVIESVLTDGCCADHALPLPSSNDDDDDDCDCTDTALFAEVPLAGKSARDLAVPSLVIAAAVPRSWSEGCSTLAADAIDLRPDSPGATLVARRSVVILV